MLRDNIHKWIILNPDKNTEELIMRNAEDNYELHTYDKNADSRRWKSTRPGRPPQR